MPYSTFRRFLRKKISQSVASSHARAGALPSPLVKSPPWIMKLLMTLWKAEFS